MWTKIEYTGDNFQDNSMKNSDDFSSESDENLKKKTFNISGNDLKSKHQINKQLFKKIYENLFKTVRAYDI